MKKVKNSKTMKKFVEILKNPEMRVLPGSIAFYFALSIVPTIMIIAFICSTFGMSISTLLDSMNHILPADVIKVLHPIVENIGISHFSFIYILVGLFLASNGTHSLILVSNTLYDIPNSSYLSRRIKSFLMIIIMGFLFLFVLVFLAFGNRILSFILSLELLSNFSNSIYNIFIVLKWPFALLVIYFFMKVLFTVAPDKRVPSKYVTRGCFLTTIGWTFATAIYALYANNISNYDIIYGSLSSIIVLMVWLYVLSYILVVGIALNVELYDSSNKEK